jgi:hypothetical protein
MTSPTQSNPPPTQIGPPEWRGFAQPGPAKQRRPRRWLPYAAAVLALLAGVGIGIGIAGRPAPEVQTVIKTVQGPTVTETVDATPAACTTALDLAERNFTLEGQAMNIAADSFDAIASFDTARIEANTAKMTALTKKMNALTGPYQDAAAQCRAAS